MKIAATALLAAALLCAAQQSPVVSAQAVAPGAKKPCLESGGVAITLNGNFGFCYLKGRRMRPDSVFAQCDDGAMTCYKDEGIPDKPREKVACIAPEPGFCGSSADATPAPTTSSPANATEAPAANATEAPAASATATPAANATDASTAGDAEDVGEEEDAVDASSEERGANDESTINPSALVAGNLSNGETYEDEEADDADDALY